LIHVHYSSCGGSVFDPGSLREMLFLIRVSEWC
jgi:hypothetical protein